MKEDCGDCPTLHNVFDDGVVVRISGVGLANGVGLAHGALYLEKHVNLPFIETGNLDGEEQGGETNRLENALREAIN